MGIPCFIDYGNMGGGEMMPDMENQIFFIETEWIEKIQIEELKAIMRTQISLSQRTSSWEMPSKTISRIH